MTEQKPKLRVNVYGSDAPAAARFSVGAKSLDEINQATEARRTLSQQQSTTTNGPISRDGD